MSSRSRRASSGRSGMTACGMPEYFDTFEVVKEKVKKLVDFIRKSKYTVVYTGAGISTSAGIPDYRGPSGVWTLKAKGEKVEEPDFLKLRPTISHMAVAKLLQLGFIHHIVSQNIDGLHRRSGVSSSDISELHGNCCLETCINCKQEYFRSFTVWNGLTSSQASNAMAAARASQLAKKSKSNSDSKSNLKLKTECKEKQEFNSGLKSIEYSKTRLRSKSMSISEFENKKDMDSDLKSIEYSKTRSKSKSISEFENKKNMDSDLKSIEYSKTRSRSKSISEFENKNNLDLDLKTIEYSKTRSRSKLKSEFENKNQLNLDLKTMEDSKKKSTPMSKSKSKSKSKSIFENKHELNLDLKTMEDSKSMAESNCTSHSKSNSNLTKSKRRENFDSEKMKNRNGSKNKEMNSINCDSKPESSKKDDDYDHALVSCIDEHEIEAMDEVEQKKEDLKQEDKLKPSYRMFLRKRKEERVEEKNENGKKRRCLEVSNAKNPKIDPDFDHKTGRLCEKDECNGELIDSVILFGEVLSTQTLENANRHSGNAELALVLGSSLRVGPACDFPTRVLSRRGKLIIVNLQKTPLDSRAALVIHSQCDVVMKLVMEEMGIHINNELKRKKKFDENVNNLSNSMKLIIS